MMMQFFIVSVSKTGYFLGTQNKNYKYVGVRFPGKCKVDRGVKNALIKQSILGFVLEAFG